MTSSAISSANRSRQSQSAATSLTCVLNLLGLFAGVAVAVTSMWLGSPIGFFIGLAGALYCVDGVRQSW